MAVENQKRNVQLQVDADRLRCEKDALELILTSHCRWMKSTERLLQERKPDECRKLAEQCKVSSFFTYLTFLYIFSLKLKMAPKFETLYICLLHQGRLRKVLKGVG